MLPIEAIIKNIPMLKEEFFPHIKSVLSLLEDLAVELEPSVKKLFIDKAVEYTFEKFKKYMDAGFTREEAFALILNDKKKFRESILNMSRNTKSSPDKDVEL